MLIAAADPKKANKVPKPLEFFEAKHAKNLITDPKKSAAYLRAWASQVNKP